MGWLPQQRQVEFPRSSCPLVLCSLCAEDVDDVLPTLNTESWNQTHGLFTLYFIGSYLSYIRTCSYWLRDWLLPNRSSAWCLGSDSAPPWSNGLKHQLGCAGSFRAHPILNNNFWLGCCCRKAEKSVSCSEQKTTYCYIIILHYKRKSFGSRIDLAAGFQWL